MIPSYAELTKACKDLFAKNYHFGKLNSDTKSTACYGTEISTNTHQIIEDKSVSGEVQIKNTWPCYGLVVTNKWNTKNLQTNEVTCTDYLYKGLKVGAMGSYNIDTGVKAGNINALFRLSNGDSCIPLRATVDGLVEGGDETAVVANGSAVVSCKNGLIGYQFKYDTEDGTLKKNDIAIGYMGCNFIGTIGLDNLNTLVGHYHHKITDRVEAAVQASSKTDDGTFFAVGGKYIIDPEGTDVRGKVDNKGFVGVGCGIKVTEGCKVYFSGNVDLKSFEGPHKVGLGLDFQ